MASVWRAWMAKPNVRGTCGTEIGALAATPIAAGVGACASRRRVLRLHQRALGAMGEAKAQVGDRESRQRDAEPQEAVREHRALQPDQARVLLDRRPLMRQIFDDEADADRIEQRPQVRA